MRDFISTTEGYYTEINVAERPKIIKHVLQAKIKGNAKTNRRTTKLPKNLE
jgi:hypothetical protein